MITLQAVLRRKKKSLFEKMKQPNKLAEEMRRYFTEEELRMDSKRGRVLSLVSEENGI